MATLKVFELRLKGEEEVYSRTRRHQRRQPRQQSSRTHSPQPRIHRIRKQREDRSETESHYAVGGESGGGDGPVGDDEVGEYGVEDEVGPCAEGDGGEDGDDPVDGGVGRESEPEETWIGSEGDVDDEGEGEGNVPMGARIPPTWPIWSTSSGGTWP